MDMQVELAGREMERIGAQADRQGQAYADLRDDFVEAFTIGNLGCMLPTPASAYGSHMSLSEWMADEISSDASPTLAQLLALLGDAAQGKPVQAMAATLIRGLACEYAQHQIDGSDWGAE